MKKSVILMLIVCISLTLVSCGATNSESNSSQPDKEYNAEIYDGQYAAIKCTKITNKGVEFDVTSKLDDNTMKVMIGEVSLDGQTPTIIGSGTNWVELQPGATATAVYEAEIPNVDHKLMSIFCVLFNDLGSAVENIDVADFDLGGEEHIDFDEPKGTPMFSNTEFEINYIRPVDEGLLFRCYNHEDYRLQVGVTEVASINGKSINLSGESATDIAAHSAKDYVVNIKNHDPDFVPDKVEHFKLFGGYRSRYYEQSPFPMEI